MTVPPPVGNFATTNQQPSRPVADLPDGKLVMWGWTTFLLFIPATLPIGITLLIRGRR